MRNPLPFSIEFPLQTIFHSAPRAAKFTYAKSFQPLAFSIIFSFLLSACSDPLPPDLTELQKSREALQIENAQLKEKAALDAFRIKNLEEDLRVKTKDWSDRSTKMSEESRARQEAVDQLTTENEQLTTQLAGFQKAEKEDARTEAKGTQIPILKTRNGDIYKNVTIRSVVPDGLHIVHQNGATKVLFTELDPSWGDRFGYNTKEAQAYSQAQAQQKAAVQRAQLETLAAQQKQSEEDLAINKSAATNRKNNDDDPAKAQLAALRAALLDELQDVASGMKGNMSISRSEPENSLCFNNNLITLRLSRARDLRAQINDLKRRAL